MLPHGMFPAGYRTGPARGWGGPTSRELTPRPVPCRALVVASGNDPYCDTGTSRSLARGWNAQWHLAGDYGHINSDSGVGDWAEGRELLAAFLGV
jgi:uncharacterized protein